MAVQRNNFRRLLRTVEALSDLGPQLTTEREFSQTAQVMLSTLIEASGGREGALFLFSDKPSLLTSIASQGFTMLPDPAVIPLGTRISIPGYGEGVAADTGSAVQGTTIDLWFPTPAQALAWGRRTVTITLH